MRIGRIDLPKEVLDAQANGKLVIFAGAGVSKPAPSNYPDFLGLAATIAGGVLTRQQGEPIERFLGRLQHQGIKVHKLARKHLSDPDSAPNPLHHHLVTIGSAVDGLRLVTTNFDTHFSKAAGETLGQEPETFFAPALPLGNSFEGIVYLHGSVTKDDQRIVLTDQDFARAYLTEGWARRFLLSLFRDYTVLFVGYSHDDTVMSYLARGLPQGYGRTRYALTAAREQREDHWRFLGIVPLPYPQEYEHDHSAVLETLAEWAKRSSWSMLDHEKRIRTILTGAPPLSPEEDDYLEASLTDASRIQFFARHAVNPVWLSWAEEKKALDPLFQPQAQLSECQRSLAFWISGKFACEYTEDCLSLLLRKGQQLNPGLWDAIINQLVYCRPEPKDEVLTRWIPILAQLASTPLQQRALCDLLRERRHPKSPETLLLLLNRLTQPELRLEERYTVSSSPDDKRQVGWTLSIPLDPTDFGEGWAAAVLPLMDKLANSVVTLAIHRLDQAYHMLVSVGGVDTTWDPVSYGRSAIESHDQDRYRKDADALIDMARDSLEWMTANRPEHATVLIRSLMSSVVPILRRLAVHCVSESCHLSAEEKVEWLLAHDLFYAYHEHHEAFRLLKSHYSLCSERLRLQVLSRAECGSERVGGDDEEYRSYAIYRLVEWLHNAAPDCQHTGEAFNQLQSEHPNFTPSEHPDLYHYFSCRGGPTDDSRITTTNILQTDPKHEIAWLLSYGRASDERDRLFFVQRVTEAVAQDRNWGWELLCSLNESGAWDTELWDGLLAGFAQSNKTQKQWRSVILFLEDNASLLQNVSPALRFLENAVADVKVVGNLSHSLLRRVERLFSLLWDKVSQTADDVTPGTGGWFFPIQDHIGGVAAKFWVLALWHYLKRHNISNHIPTRYRRALKRMLSGDSPADRVGCPMLAHYTQFFYSIDAAWTRDSILPLLDWGSNEGRAERAWHCYLNNSRVGLDVVEESMDYHRRTFLRTSTNLGLFRESFVQHIALFAVESSVDVLADNWLSEFLSSVETNDRERWARNVWIHLKMLDPKAVKDLWDRWLDRYWEQRIMGVPLPLEQGEIDEMVHWLLYLRPVFPSAVQRISSGPSPSRVPYNQLAKLDWLVDYPDPLADLAWFLLQNADRPFYHCEDVLDMVKIIFDKGGNTTRLKLICNKLCELGCPSEKLQNFMS